MLFLPVVVTATALAEEFLPYTQHKQDSEEQADDDHRHGIGVRALHAAPSGDKLGSILTPVAHHHAALDHGSVGIQCRVEMCLTSTFDVPEQVADIHGLRERLIFHSLEYLRRSHSTDITDVVHVADGILRNADTRASDYQLS